MTDQPAARPRLVRRLPGLLAAGVLLWFLVAVVGPALPDMLALRPQLRAPDWALLASQPLPIRLHLAGAVIALIIGGIQLVGVKGRTVHRVLGWSWVAAMLVAAISSLFIRQINGGAFSLVHILSGLTLVALPMAVHAARRHDVAAHRKHMTSLFLGALVLAGVLALIPGRLLWTVFVG